MNSFFKWKFKRECNLEVPYSEYYQMDVHQNTVLLERFIIMGEVDFDTIAPTDLFAHVNKFDVTVTITTCKTLAFKLDAKSVVPTDIISPLFTAHADLKTYQYDSDKGALHLIVDTKYGIHKPQPCQITHINTLGSSFDRKIPKNHARQSPTSPLAPHFTKRRDSLKSPMRSGFVGSFEESLFKNRIPIPNNRPIPFHCTCSISYTKHGIMKSFPQFNIPFEGVYYQFDSESHSPYNATIDLSNILLKHPALSHTHGLKMPGQGQLQVVIKNTNDVVVKVFLVPFDFSTMAIASNQYLRQKFYDGSLRDAIQLRFSCHQTKQKKKQIYLEPQFKVIFSTRPNFKVRMVTTFQ